MAQVCVQQVLKTDPNANAAKFSFDHVGRVPCPVEVGFERGGRRFAYFAGNLSRRGCQGKGVIKVITIGL